MKYEDFMEIVDILKKQYGNAGDKWFTPLRQDLYYAKLKYYPYDQVEKLIKEYIANNAYVPKLNDIRALVKNIKRDDEVLPEDYKCDTCHSSGWVTFFKKEDLEAMAFRCTCQKGRKLSNKIPFHTNMKVKEKLGPILTHKEYLDENNRRILYKIENNTGPQKSIVSDIVGNIGKPGLDKYMKKDNDPKRQMDIRWDDYR